MTEEQFCELIAVGRETESLEVKAGGARSDQFLGPRVIRAALGMANHEGGGWVVIGIEERNDGSFALVGIPAAHLPTWNHDDVSAMINGCAEPHIVIDTSQVNADGRAYVVIRVQEFVDIPVVCRTHGPTPPGERQILRRGACYVRSRRKSETIEAASDATAWRTLMELVGNKSTTRALRLLGVQAVATSTKPSDSDFFTAQLGDLA